MFWSALVTRLCTPRHAGWPRGHRPVPGGPPDGRSRGGRRGRRQQVVHRAVPHGLCSLRCELHWAKEWCTLGLRAGQLLESLSAAASPPLPQRPALPAASSASSYGLLLCHPLVLIHPYQHTLPSPPWHRIPLQGAGSGDLSATYANKQGISLKFDSQGSFKVQTTFFCWCRCLAALSAVQTSLAAQGRKPAL